MKIKAKLLSVRCLRSSILLLINSLEKWYSFFITIKKYKQFTNVSKNSKREWVPSWKDRMLCLNDTTAQIDYDRHYIYHPAWAAYVLAKTKPKRHVDISSTLHFCSILSAFIPVDFYDFRPANLVLKNLTTNSADITQLNWPDNSVESLSCMHVIEHIGLGRYGDPIDPDGDLKAVGELVRVLKPGGDLLVAVPVGASQICFNAHRIYDGNEFREYFGDLDLVEFSLIPDGQMLSGMIKDAQWDVANKQKYGCGCYWFRKPNQ